MEDKEKISLFGKRIKELRKKNNLSQAELAKRIGYSVNYIGMIERGQRNTTVANVFKFARVLNVKPGELFQKD